MNTAIHWTSNSKYVDTETGEEITKYNATRNYITKKIKKHVKINDIKTKGHIEYVHECRRNPQRELFTD